jgi:serine/threonine-protein kinase
MGAPKHEDSEPAMPLDAELEAEEHIRTTVAASATDVTRAVSRPDLVAATAGRNSTGTLLGMSSVSEPEAAPASKSLPSLGVPPPPSRAGTPSTPPTAVVTPTSGPGSSSRPAERPSATRSDPGARLSRPLADLPALAHYGRFALLGRIAFGGMAEIFLARETTPSGATRHLVVKRILPHVADDEGFVTMFLDEARLAMRLTHPNICHVYEFGQQDGTWFIAMEWVNGVPLGKLIRKARAVGGIPVPIAVKVMAGIAEALHYAHRAHDEDGTPLEIVHRDVSPQNIMIAYHGAVKLLDFGVARASNQITKTQAGIVKGKLAYMAPEQCRGERIDARADIFSLGVCLYESISGRPLYHRQNEFETLKALMEDPVPSLRAVRPDIDPELDAIVMRALAKMPEERFQSAGEFQEALEGWLTDRRIVVNAARISEFLHDLYAEEIARGPVLTPSPSGVAARGASAQYVVPQSGVAQAGAAGASALDSGVAMRGPQDAPARPDEDTGRVPGRARASARRAEGGLVLALLGGLGVVVVLAGLGVAWWLLGKDGAREVVAAAPEDRVPSPRGVEAPGVGVGGQEGVSRGAAFSVPSGFGTGMEVGLGGHVAGGRDALAGADAAADLPGPDVARGGSVTSGLAATGTERRGAGAIDPGVPPEAVGNTGSRPGSGGRASGGGGSGGGSVQATGSLSINTRPWSKVYVGQRLLGTTPIGAAEVRAGEVVLRLVDRDGNTHRRTVRVAPGERASAFFDLEEGP